MADLRFIRKTLKAVHGKTLQTTVHRMETNWQNYGQLEHMMVRFAQRNVMRMLATKGPLPKGAH